MRIFLAGGSCVGKTAIGARLAELLRIRFFDVDVETEHLCGMSIERLRNRHLTSHGFRLAVSQALQHVLSREDSCHCVIALPPSGLLGALWKVVSKTRDATTVVLSDTPESRANVTVDISSSGLEEASCKVWEELKSIPSNDRGN